ncbi:SURF1 family protein [Sphingomonas oligophenolica]|uniref:SURF1-like protein n=1 Tax=Sphingomonas oligophenolica TaxID=301154 RepID=A0A502C1M0_9SPHN|nr:SURF1 family protein [Sphingomonas oligophenolica]TPG06564.1 SURF1 family protein [Sphingomonas oligophenolica]
MTRTRVLRAVVGAAWIAAILGLIALGTWQVHRRAWKLDLIARVDARIHAAPVPAPTTAGKDDEYRRVRTTGRYLADKDTLVQASTVRGPGWWVMTPLASPNGTVLINRGYVPGRAPPAPPPGVVTVTGLLRLTEPGGGFLRHNDPAANRWYSRDVAAIAHADRLRLAPYFIDADAAPAATSQPVGGLTVVSFPNSHLVYAITWYTLAIMTAAGLLYWITSLRRDRRRG